MELSSNLDPKPRTLNDFFPEANQNSLQPTLSRSNGNFINIYKGKIIKRTKYTCIVRN